MSEPVAVDAERLALGRRPQRILCPTGEAPERQERPVAAEAKLGVAHLVPLEPEPLQAGASLEAEFETRPHREADFSPHEDPPELPYGERLVDDVEAKRAEIDRTAAVHSGSSRAT